MELKTKDAAVLREYLLGDLPLQEQEELELWLMSDEEAYDLLEAAEDDLIDDALAGRLQEQHLHLFNTRFLAAPERQRKLQFSRSFRRAIDAATLPAALSSPPPRTSWYRLLDAVRYRPALAYAGFALILVLATGSVWSVFKVAELQQQLRSATDQLVQAGRDREDLKRQLDESQTAARTLEAQVRTLEGSIKATNPSSAPVLMAVNLMPGITRSSNDVPKITLNATTSLVRFSLPLLDDNFTTYRASLMNADGRETWSRNNLAATATREGKAIVLTVPAEVLSNGDYSFSLMGVPNTGTPENIGRYYFRAVRP